MQLRINAPKIWVYSEAIDFRKSIDGLVCLVETGLGVNPKEGIFIFCNRSKDKLKVLAWHGNGFVMLYKRLESGKFKVVNSNSNEPLMIDEKALSWLLAGLDWHTMSHWNELTYNDFY